MFDMLRPKVVKSTYNIQLFPMTGIVEAEKETQLH